MRKIGKVSLRISWGLFPPCRDTFPYSKPSPLVFARQRVAEEGQVVF